MNLREKIIHYMRDQQPPAQKWIPTWWFKFHISGVSGTAEIRRELERMEREGLVESDHTQSNKTLWKLKQQAGEVTP